jgi:heme-degrading monooxygenase HmoA
MAVTLVNCFDIPAGREDEFFTLWQEVNAYMRNKPGYLGHRMHKAVSPDASFRFVNVAQWSSTDHFRAAHDHGFRALVNKPDWSPFKSQPGLYQVVHEG